MKEKNEYGFKTRKYLISVLVFSLLIPDCPHVHKFMPTSTVLGKGYISTIEPRLTGLGSYW